MTPLVLFAMALPALAALLVLDRQRRLFLHDSQRRRFLVLYMATPAEPARPLSQRGPGTSSVGAEAQLPAPQASNPVPAAQPEERRATTAAPAAPQSADQGVLLVDTTGHCTFADDTARTLLQWHSDTLALGDLLGGQRWISVLATLARDGQVELAAGTDRVPTPLRINVVALRDREDNLWGAALFVRRE